MVKCLSRDISFPAEVVHPGQLRIGVNPNKMVLIKFGEPAEELIPVTHQRSVRVHYGVVLQHGRLMDQLIEKDPDLEFVFMDLLIAVVDLIACVNVQIAIPVFLSEAFCEPGFSRCDMTAHKIHICHLYSPPCIPQTEFTMSEAFGQLIIAVSHAKMRSRKGRICTGGEAMKKFWKTLRTVFVVLIAVAAVLCCILEVYPALFDTAAPHPPALPSADWMAALDDSLLLSEINIPGVHDAAANETQLRLLTKCQDRRIDALLLDGFRYLDIRLGVEEMNGKKDLTFYHGFLHCLKDIWPWSGHLTFRDVALDCTAFLKRHPNETILFVVKQEHGGESVAEFEKLLDDLITESDGSEQWLLTDSIPTLGEARGKIVHFRRYTDEARLGKRAGIYIDWVDQGNRPKEGNAPGVVMEEKETFRLFIQDRFSYDAETKWQVFSDAAAAERGPGDVLINFLSTKGTAPYGHPHRFAKELNTRLDPKNTSVLSGWTIIDFGNAYLADIIIRSNPAGKIGAMTVKDTGDSYASGRVFVWEKEGFGGDFTIRLNDDGTYMYYAGALSSYIGMGRWSVQDGIVVLAETSGYDNVFRFSMDGDDLVFLADESSEFMYVTVENGDRFRLSDDAAS